MVEKRDVIDVGGRLRRPPTWVLVVSGAMLVALIFITCAVTAQRHSRTARPVPGEVVSLTPGTDFQVNASDADRTASYAFTLTNPTEQALAVEYVGKALPPGFTSVAPTTTSPVTLKPKTSIRLTITVRVADCSKAFTQSWPLPLSVRLADQAQWRTVRISPPASPGKQWPGEIVAAVCPTS